MMDDFIILIQVQTSFFMEWYFLTNIEEYFGKRRFIKENYGYFL